MYFYLSVVNKGYKFKVNQVYKEEKSAQTDKYQPLFPVGLVSS